MGWDRSHWDGTVTEKKYFCYVMGLGHKFKKIWDEMGRVRCQVTCDTWTC